ncbi:fungal-specific transcription factor domain-containing protein [Mycena amicta]|nr:fungal-specific transcription factor domain-containing protein [Mycena amicta]
MPAGGQFYNPGILVDGVTRAVKTEPPPSPALVAFHPHSQQLFQPFRIQPTPSASLRDSPPFRFGLSATPPSLTHSESNSTPTTSQMASNATEGLNWPAGAPAYTLPFHEYDDEDDDGLDDGPGRKSSKDKAVRRRSSKACDQCRKSKCKCERTSPDAPCRSCVALKTECTFLGPSRKRGPPKGYIDAIEARLHQTEALVGILLSAGGLRAVGGKVLGIEDDLEDDDERGRAREVATGRDGHGPREIDERARELMADLAEDPVARAILLRIDQSAYGPAGRATGTGSGRNSASGSGRGSPAGRIRGNGAGADASSMGDLGSMHPSHEWMDRVTDSILRRARGRRAGRSDHSPYQQHVSPPPTFDRSHSPAQSNGRAHSGLSPYRYSYPQGQQQPHHPPQRPAIITALGEYGNAPRPVYPQSAGPVEDRRTRSFAGGRMPMPLSAGADGPSYSHPYASQGGRALPLSATADGRPMAFGAGGDGRRLRRRVDDGADSASYYSARPASPDASGSDAELDLDVDIAEASRDEREQRGRERLRGGVSSSSLRSGPGLAGLAGAVGQLSLNEDKEVRYHGKASGLHLLARRPVAVPTTSEERREQEAANVTVKREEDGQNAGGIWRFPKARVWPAAPPPDEWDADGVVDADKDGLPPPDVQSALLDRYFTHVHPNFPVVHKQSVMEAFSRGEGPPLLLLAMYALAARHAPQPAYTDLEARQCMWPAGDTFLFRAKTLLDSSYASSRASTCAALLLMGFREIGIGAMAQAWIYIGMAVRMAQDLGMHRDADGWVRAGVRVGRTAATGEGGAGTPASSQDEMTQDSDERNDEECQDGSCAKDGKLFAAWEISGRRRIWYACVIMDKYVSTYIGRPLAIYERDFDTSLPSETDAEETEEWSPSAEAPVQAPPRPGRVISCFNASARLANILSQILQSIYALRPQASRHVELVVLDGQLDKWRLSLPPHLQYDPAVRTSAAEVPLPPVLTLHMQYWCAVLLLYRPFIRQNANKTKSPVPDDHDARGHAEKSYELCASAANHITTIATLYSETYTLKHCPVFLCYYTFTASIMHVTSLFSFPKDPQARMGLSKCMEALQEMEIIWPAAARALVLLRGAQSTLADVTSEMELNSVSSRVRKRSATHTLDDSFGPDSGSFVATRPYEVYDASGHYALDPSRNSFYPPASSTAYQRWQGPGTEALAFQGGAPVLSTAVMGPTYSTGLIDERHHRSSEPRYAQQPPHAQQQYWSDYAPPAFSPLGAPTQQVYEPLHDHSGINVQHPSDSQMYSPMHQQYNMYSHHGA